MPKLKTPSELQTRQRAGQGALEVLVRELSPRSVKQRDHIAEIAVALEYRTPGIAANVLDAVMRGDSATAIEIVEPKLAELFHADPYIAEDEPNESELRAVLLARPPSPGREGADHGINSVAEAARMRSSPQGRHAAYQVRWQLYGLGLPVPMNAERK